MRFVEVEPGLRLRFPGRSEDFADGVEIGALAAAMALGHLKYFAQIAAANLEQARALAESLGYTMFPGAASGDCLEATFYKGSRRPKLRVVR
jgi:hypothetical protein